MDPHGALPRIDEQSTQYDEPASAQNYRLDPGGVSNITQGLADTSLNPTYPDSRQYEDDPRQSEDRSRDDKRKGKGSSYSDDRQGRDRKSKNRKGEPSYGMKNYLLFPNKSEFNYSRTLFAPQTSKVILQKTIQQQNRILEDQIKILSQLIMVVLSQKQLQSRNFNTRLHKSMQLRVSTHHIQLLREVPAHMVSLRAKLQATQPFLHIMWRHRHHM